MVSDQPDFGPNAYQVRWIVQVLWSSDRGTVNALGTAFQEHLQEPGMLQLEQLFLESARSNAISVDKLADLERAIQAGRVEGRVITAYKTDDFGRKVLKDMQQGLEPTGASETLVSFALATWLDGVTAAIEAVVLRPFITDKQFQLMWTPFEPIVGLLERAAE